jgi:hypothetical protein
MAKKKLVKKQIRSIKKEHVLWATIIILAALLASTIWYIVKTSSVDTDKTSKLPVTLTSAQKEEQQRFVNDIEVRRYKLPVIDIKENRVYIPEVRAYVPLSENSRDIRYQAFNDTIWLSHAMAVGRQTGDENASCDRVVLVVPSEDRGRDYIAEGTIKASDGSTRYIFRHPACDIYGDDFSKRLVEVAKEIQYY